VAQSFIQLPGGTQTGPKQVTEDIGTPGHVLQVKPYEPPTFYAIYDRIAVGAVNKYLAVLWNGASNRLVRVWRAWVYQNSTAAVATGLNSELAMLRISARTAGTAVTPMAADLSDTLTSGIAASHNDSAVTDSTIFRRFFAAQEEAKTTAAQAFNSDTQTVFDWFGHDGHLFWNTHAGCKPITLRNGQGIAVKNISGTLGALSFVIEFTDEPV
jgi:hypothetical protein